MDPNRQRTRDLTRRWVIIQFVALAITVGTLARVVVGGAGALIVAGVVFGAAMVGWALVGLVDAQRRRRDHLHRARS